MIEKILATIKDLNLGSPLTFALGIVKTNSSFRNITIFSWMGSIQPACRIGSTVNMGNNIFWNPCACRKLKPVPTFPLPIGTFWSPTWSSRITKWYWFNSLVIGISLWVIQDFVVATGFHQVLETKDSYLKTIFYKIFYLIRMQTNVSFKVFAWIFRCSVLSTFFSSTLFWNVRIDSLSYQKEKFKSYIQFWNQCHQSQILIFHLSSVV